MLRSIIKKLNLFLSFFSRDYYFKNYLNKQEARLIASFKEYIQANGTVFYKTAEVVNFQKNKQNITIGNGTHISGRLMTFPYGGKIEIGSNCFVGEDTRIWSANNIMIGNNVQISFNVTIIDSDSHEIDSELRKHTAQQINDKGFHTLTSAPNIKTAPIIIEDDVWISFNAVILKGVTIGKRSIIAAGAIVTKDVLPDTIVAGNPAKVVKHITT